MSVFSKFDWRKTRAHYDLREHTHSRLRELLKNGDWKGFTELALGVIEPSGNYSAAEHGIGPKILVENLNVERRVSDLALKFTAVKNAHEVPELIKVASIKYLRIGIGSEMSCMINPHHCYVANVRTIWTHLVYKHDDNFGKANEELRLYRESDVASEMAYEMWRELHAELAGTITRVAEQGERLARLAGVEPGGIRYLWADAMATQLYDEYHSDS